MKQEAMEQTVHPMKQSHTFISTAHIDLHNLNVIESVALSLALVLSVTIGTLFSAFSLTI